MHSVRHVFEEDSAPLTIATPWHGAVRKLLCEEHAVAGIELQSPHPNLGWPVAIDRVAPLLTAADRER